MITNLEVDYDYDCVVNVLNRKVLEKHKSRNSDNGMGSISVFDSEATRVIDCADISRGGLPCLLMRTRCSVFVSF